jgi:hypothetical protein
MIRELVDEVIFNVGSVHSILTADSGLKRISAKFVPKLQPIELKHLLLYRTY